MLNAILIINHDTDNLKMIMITVMASHFTSFHWRMAIPQKWKSHLWMEKLKLHSRLNAKATPSTFNEMDRRKRGMYPSLE